VPESYSKKEARREIEEGLAEYLSSPRSKEGIHKELRDSFEEERAKEPLRREDIEREIEEFTRKNLERVLPILLSEEVDSSALIKKLGITNEQIGLLGANYFIREEEGKLRIFQANEFYPDGLPLDDPSSLYGVEIRRDLILALAWAKEAIRIDTQNEANRINSRVPHRYFLRSKNRYLCANDFGMRVFDEGEGKMFEGRVDDAGPFIETIAKEFSRIRENLESAFSPIAERIRKEADKEIPLPNYDDFEDSNEFYKELGEKKAEQRRIIDQRLIDAVFKHFDNNPRDLDLILGAMPKRKGIGHLHFHYDRIIRRYRLIGNDPREDYERFKRYRYKRIERLLREPNDHEKAGTTLPFIFSDLFQKPVIVEDDFDKNVEIEEIKKGVQDILACRAARADEEIKEVFEAAICSRGKGSPYFYNDYQLYDFIRIVGPERAKMIIDADDRAVSRQLEGFDYLRRLGYNLRDWEPAQVRKQLYEASKLAESGIWYYLKGKMEPELRAICIKKGSKVEGKHWLEILGRRKARELFYQGKQMYWLAKEVYKCLGKEEPFYHYESSVDWGIYDFEEIEGSHKRINEYLIRYRNLIIPLLREGFFIEQQEESRGKVTLGLIIKAIESGQDLRGVAIAYDKRRYLEGVVQGKKADDIAFILADWPEKWKEVLSDEEITLYYEYGNDYIQLDPDGLVKYAQWKATTEGKKWSEIFRDEPSKKDDIDFRICLGMQPEEVRDWCRKGAEYVGFKIMQDYLLRFNVTTQETLGQWANWHDALFWVSNIHNLEPEEAKAILAGIQTMEDNRVFAELLPRYSRDRDPLLDQGAIKSLRELKKRVLAIEANIDLSTLPQEVLEITTAPGFNLSALERLSKRANFHDLVEGKMDKEQPFKPYRRIFAERDLTEALREGLGSRELGIKGTALSPRKLFHELKKLIKGRTIGKEGRKMEVADLLDKVPIDLEEEIIQLLRKQKVNIGAIVEAQIHAKSDPEGWVCGNYTDCCMSFGESNNNDYMFNPSTQYFTIKYNDRIVAQSVVVDSIDIETGEDVVVLDNIEVANNYKKFSPFLGRVYQVFWTEYTSKPVKIGAGYSDLIPPGSRLDANNYRPKTPLVYSDAKGEYIYNLPKITGIESIDMAITFANPTERDAELIAKLEKEIYPEGMVQGKSHILDIIKRQREMGVPGGAASFIVRQGKEVAGYLLMLPENSEINPDEKVLHIYDLAILPKFRGKGLTRKMIERVLDVATAYGGAIEAEARASTSYALLMNSRVRRWLESKGFYLVKNEKLPEYMGGEDYYFIRLENRQNPEELELENI